MIVSRTPFRISFFGGGTDFPSWYENNGGSVISTSINKYCYVTIRELPSFFKYKYSIRYKESEIVNNINEIKHPSVKNCFKEVLNNKERLEMIHHADLPALSGIGSSSSFTVGLLNCLYYLKNKNLNKRKLALKAIDIEQNKIKENVGSQHQTIATFGGFNKINFSLKKKIEVNPIPISSKNSILLNKSIVLFFTGFTRNSSEVTKYFLKNLKNNSSILNETKIITDEAFTIFKKKEIDLNKFGFYLNESWKLKRRFSSKVTNEFIDSMYKKGINKGAYGGKLLGAGSGGFICFLIEPRIRKKFISNFKNLLHIPIKLENTGSRIIYFN